MVVALARRWELILLQQQAIQAVAEAMNVMVMVMVTVAAEGGIQQTQLASHPHWESFRTQRHQEIREAFSTI